MKNIVLICFVLANHCMYSSVYISQLFKEVCASFNVDETFVPDQSVMQYFEKENDVVIKYFIKQVNERKTAQQRMADEVAERMSQINTWITQNPDKRVSSTPERWLQYLHEHPYVVNYRPEINNLAIELKWLLHSRNV